MGYDFLRRYLFGQNIAHLLSYAQGAAMTDVSVSLVKLATFVPTWVLRSHGEIAHTPLQYNHIQPYGVWLSIRLSANLVRGCLRRPFVGSFAAYTVRLTIVCF